MLLPLLKFRGGVGERCGDSTATTTPVQPFKSSGALEAVSQAATLSTQVIRTIEAILKPSWLPGDSDPVTVPQGDFLLVEGTAATVWPAVPIWGLPLEALLWS